MEQRLCTEEFIIDLFCRIDRAMIEVTKHPQAKLWPSELTTLAILFVLKGRSERAFDRWVHRDLAPLFPKAPERSRLFRLLVAHHDWAERFLADPTFFGIADSFGIELISTRRLGRSGRQIAQKGKCAGKWIAGAKLGLVINCHGQFCAWDVTTANVYDADAFSPLIEKYAQRMIVLADCNFHKSPYHRKAGDRDPPNVKICPRGWWNQRRLIETVLSMVQNLCRIKKLTERSWPMLRAHLAFVAAAFNILTNWTDHVQLAIAQFAL
jgi:hypothetical protein